jgi:hypothetical protein
VDEFKGLSSQKQSWCVGERTYAIGGADSGEKTRGLSVGQGFNSGRAGRRDWRAEDVWKAV